MTIIILCLQFFIFNLQSYQIFPDNDNENPRISQLKLLVYLPFHLRKKICAPCELKKKINPKLVIWYLQLTLLNGYTDIPFCRHEN
ncbi:hypothetical protein C1646_685604 [Rhizophagus diaphanus]|nr:hypothetical protein C1646_685604 [Rhizophagus diaphanus] [Rhizophagus sp. MUCL 43196]